MDRRATGTQRYSGLERHTHGGVIMNKRPREIPISNEPDTDNPWYRNRHTKYGRFGYGGILLPKRVVRPFWTPAMVSIDDKRMVLEGIGKRDFLSILSGLCLVIGGSVLIVWFVANSGFSTDFYVALAFLTLSLILYLWYKRSPVSWYKYFERDTGIFETRHGFTRKRYRLNFSDCEARLSTRPTYVGSINYSLSIVSPGTGGFHLMELSASGTDILLGYWSFLVQYMDKNKPLPDVKELSAYPDREPGLGSWQEWEEKEKQLDFVDPYINWLRELELNPKLDLANYYRDNNYRKWSWAQGWFYMFLIFMAVPNLFHMFDFSSEGLFMSWKAQKFMFWIAAPIAALSGLVSYFFFRKE
jgi:hypothetical protein